MKKLIFLFLIVPLVFISCNHKTHPKKIARIDSLLKVVDSIEKNLSKIDTINVKKVYEEYQDNLGMISAYFKEKKEDSTWSTITAYGVINSPLKKFVKDYSSLYHDIKYSRKQLDSLKYDIEHDNLEKEKVDTYTNNECTAVNALKMQSFSDVKGAIIELRLFDSLSPKIDRVIEKLKKENKIDPKKKSTFKGGDDD